jgi:hypothetical protein
MPPAHSAFLLYVAVAISIEVFIRWESHHAATGHVSLLYVALGVLFVQRM